MTAQQDHVDLNKRLRKTYGTDTDQKRYVRFPAFRRLEISTGEGRATLKLCDHNVTANMQDDAGAFDAWALVLLRWLKFERIVIDWKEADPSHTGYLHYQRFLYRAHHLRKMFPNCIELSGPMDALFKGSDKGLVLGISGKRARPKAVSPPLKSENEIEVYLTQPECKSFRIEHGLSRLERQLPVGVYRNKISENTAVFTRGKSAIDLIGVDDQAALWIFELKKPTNIPVGALSELMFYSMVMSDIRRRTIGLAGPWFEPTGDKRIRISANDLLDASKIHARILACEMHPLIDCQMLDLLNDASSLAGLSTDFGYVDLKPFLPE